MDGKLASTIEEIRSNPRPQDSFVTNAGGKQVGWRVLDVKPDEDIVKLERSDTLEIFPHTRMSFDVVLRDTKQHIVEARHFVGLDGSQIEDLN